MLCFLIAALLLVMPMSALASGISVSVSAPGTLPAVGSTFTVTVSISGNPGMCVAQYTLQYDSSVVECQSVSAGAALSGGIIASNPAASDGARVACVSVDPLDSDGVMSQYTFKVLKSGNPAFALSGYKFADADGNVFTVSVSVPSVSSDGGKTATETPQPTAKPDDGKKTESTPQPTKQPDEAAETANPNDESGREEEQVFPDVAENTAEGKTVEKAAGLKLVIGDPDGSFAPERDMTRAEFVTVLFRLSGVSAVSEDAGFADVGENSWYRDAVNWAAVNGYVSGDGIRFYPNYKISRQEIATILFRYNGGTSGMEAMLGSFGVDYLSDFVDGGKVALWAQDAMRWAVFNCIFDDTDGNELNPRGAVIRTDAVDIVVRYSEEYN